MEIVTQLITLGGVAIGAAATYLVTSLTEKATWRRTEAIRWDKERLGAYLAWLDAIKAMIMISSRLVEAKGVPAGVSPIDEANGMALLDQVELDRSSKFEGVLLLGSTEAIAAAQKVNEAAWLACDVASGRRELAEESWLAAYRGYRVAREQFYASARASINVPAADIPLSLWVTPVWTTKGLAYGEHVDH